MLSLKNVETNEVVAVLYDVDLKSRLADFRARIQSELSRLSVSNYEFSVCGIGIKRKQEQKYEIGKCLAATPSKDSPVSIEIRFLSGPDAENKPEDGINKTDPQIIDTDNQRQKPLDQYPRYFTQEEIDSSLEELERQRKIFFNKKLAEIIGSCLLEDWKKQEIHGVINVHWVLRKTEILKNSVQESIASSTAENSQMANQNPSQIEKNMMKNFDNLEKAQFMVDHHYNQLSEELSKNGEESRVRLEKEFDQIFSQLKIAQANLTKSITEYRNMQACQLLQREENNEELMIISDAKEECCDILDSEMDDLVLSVKDNFDE